MKKIIRCAMDEWEKKTCIKFVPHKSEEDYVIFVKQLG